MKYKIGDRIKIINFPDPKMNGCIGKVISEANSLFVCEIRLDKGKYNGWTCFMNDCEIRSCRVVGEQLLFDFMKED